MLYARDLCGASGGAATVAPVGEGPARGVERLVGARPGVEEKARALVDGAVARGPELDGHIARAAEHWRFERIGVIDRNVLRLGVLELLEARTPPRVVLDEAVRLARWFGGVKSPAFVNGVLDRVARDLGLL
jgi:N utilization substance protein B